MTPMINDIVLTVEKATQANNADIHLCQAPQIYLGTSSYNWVWEPLHWQNRGGHAGLMTLQRGEALGLTSVQYENSIHH